MMRHSSQPNTIPKQISIESLTKYDRSLKFDDSPRAKEERFLVIKPSDKTKIVKENRREIGFEYDHDVTSDILLCQKILETNTYNPTFENIIDFSEDLSRIIATSQTADSRNAGTVIGMTVFGAVGFIALSFTIVGALAGGILGVGMGRYAGRKITKRMRRKKAFTGEELFRIKLQSLIKMGKIQQSEMKHNLNKYRLQLEKILQEFALVFDLSLFEKPKKIAAILQKLNNFLLNVTNQKAMLLSYKLLKNYLKLVQSSKQDTEKEIVGKVYSVFIPFKKALEFSSKKDKKLNKITTYVKINSFLEKPEIQEILKQNPDSYAEPSFLQTFKNKLKEPVDIEEKIGQALKWDRKKVHEVFSNIQEMPSMNRLDRGHSSTSTIQNKNLNASNDIHSQSKLRQATQKEKEARLEQNLNLSTIFDEDVDEGVSVAIKKPRVNLVKFNSDRFKIGSLTPGSYDQRALTDRNVAPVKASFSNPMRANYHSLSQNNMPSSSFTEAFAKSLASKNTNYHKFALEVESSDDSSNDDAEDEEEQKKMMEDSYLFLKSQIKNTPEQQFNFCSNNGIDIPMTPSRNKIDNQNEIRGRNSIEASKRFNIRPQSENRCGPGIEKPKLQIVKINSNLKMDDPDLEPPSRASYIDGHSTIIKPEEKNDLDNSKQQVIEYVPEIKQSEMKAEPRKRQIDTKQEIIFQKLLSITADTHSKWDVIKNDKELKVFKIKPENSDVVLIKAWAFIPDVTPKQIFNCIYDTNIRGKWDTVLSNPHVVEKIDETFDIFYFCVKAPFAVSNRDFVQKRCYQYDYPEKGDIIISFQSTTHPKAPPIKGTVRGETHIAGYIMKPAKNGKGSELHVITQVDVKGSIPKMVVNFVAGRAPADWIIKLKKACTTWGK